MNDASVINNLLSAKAPAPDTPATLTHLHFGPLGNLTGSEDGLTFLPVHGGSFDPKVLNDTISAAATPLVMQTDMAKGLFPSSTDGAQATADATKPFAAGGKITAFNYAPDKGLTANIASHDGLWALSNLPMITSNSAKVPGTTGGPEDGNGSFYSLSNLFGSLSGATTAPATTAPATTAPATAAPATTLGGTQPSIAPDAINLHNAR